MCWRINLSLLGGWPSLVSKLLGPGGIIIPSSHKSSKQSGCGKPNFSSKTYLQYSFDMETFVNYRYLQNCSPQGRKPMIRTKYWQFRPGAGPQLTISCSQVSIVQHYNNSTSIEKMLLQSFLVDHENRISHLAWMLPLNRLNAHMFLQGAGCSCYHSSLQGAANYFQ